jgi:outer membrane protein insertion porin family
MTLKSVVRAALLHASLVAAAGSAVAQTGSSPEEFTVGDIRVEGLQRISEGTVYNYLPVNIGDRMDARRVREAVRALYGTGFFRDIEVRRDGATLVIAVLERPSIESFEIKGNKDLKTEDLQKSLKNVGLAAGKTFDQSTLDEVKQYLTDQYFSKGKYAVRVDAKVEEVAGNKVKVTIEIAEGKRARIRQINIVGNTAFDDEELIKQFKLKTPNWLSFYKQDDRYSKEELSGDLETLRSYYQDRGYANFEIDSAQVTIAPEKDDMFITINVSEGEVFQLGEIKLAGNLVVPEQDLKALIFISPGETYSRKRITAVTEAMVLRLGLDGYAFAKVDPVPQIDPQTKKVALTFLVEPGNRVYVRRINFNGSTSVNDDVFRREMRQLEGSYLSNRQVERSKQLIERLPFIEKVEFESKPVAGSSDLVDVDFKIKEGLPGQFTASVGYSRSQSFLLSGSFAHSNFMGTGNRVAAEIQGSQFGQVYSFSQTDPYTTVDGLSRTISVGFRKIKQFNSQTSSFDTRTASLGVDFGYPISEYQGIRFGLATQLAELVAPTTTSQQLIDWVRNNGAPFIRTGTIGFPPQSIDTFGARANTYEISVGWGYDSRNRTLFADRGSRYRITGSYTLPFSDAEFWTTSIDAVRYVPIWRGFTLQLNAELFYGAGLGDTTSLPPYRNQYAGGPGTVRGYRESRLGPIDFALNGTHNPYGGNLKTVAQTELLLPVPEKFRNSARASLFFDIGNVFSTENVQFFGVDDVTPVDYKFSFGDLKRSAGVAVQWLAPLGIFRFSYAVPLNARGPEGARFGDPREAFQFSIGQAF